MRRAPLANGAEAQARDGHCVWMRFDDGLAGEIDLAPHLDGEVLAPLRDPAYFRHFTVGEARTLTWPNGADFAPEFLHDLVREAMTRTTV